MMLLARIPRLARCLIRPQQFRAFSTSKLTNTSSKTDEPYKYFGTQAEKIRALPTPEKRPEYSPIIISLSLLVFLVYFLILREENDTDELLKRDLYDHFGEEASRLKKAYDYNIKHNLPTQEIVHRLREIGAPVPPMR